MRGRDWFRRIVGSREAEEEAHKVLTGSSQPAVLPLMAYSLDPPMLVSDLMDDGNLRQYLSRVGWPLPLGLKLLLDVATGMAYLHSKHIVHGDLKSANIMVDEQRALIADFGLSRFRQELVSSGASSSRSVLMGTPGFVAPEVLAGSSAGFPSDVYSFAMVCYEVVSRGRVPFAEQPNVAAMLYKVAVEHARPARPEGVTDAVWGLIERCWAHEPAVRPNFVQVRDELARITGHA